MYTWKLFIAEQQTENASSWHHKNKIAAFGTRVAWEDIVLTA